MNTITIPKNQIKKAGGVVILSLKEYQKLREQAVPTYYLQGKEAKELDKLIENGLKAHHEGKCRTISSLSDLD